jgi:hypothetical protein
MIELTLNKEFIEKENKIIIDSITFWLKSMIEPIKEFFLFEEKSSEDGVSNIKETSLGRWHCLKRRECI